MSFLLGKMNSSRSLLAHHALQTVRTKALARVFAKQKFPSETLLAPIRIKSQNR